MIGYFYEEGFDNYRGISNLQVIAKLFERILCAKVTSHFDRNCLFVDQQHGFKSFV